MTQWVVLPADVFDALELSALAHDGVGAARRFYAGRPHCIVGHAQFLDGITHKEGMRIDEGATVYLGHEVCDALIDAFGRSLYKVAEMNDRMLEIGELVSWDEWCRRMNVVRGYDA